MGDIEVELRSFISEEQYRKLLEFFNKNAKFLKEDYQETYYFDGKEDLRIQKNNFFSKIWMKKGRIHDDMREEIEVRFDKDDFDRLEKLFLSLGFNIKIKWFRTRHEFDWDNISVCLDYTKGYGYIIELEILTNDNDKEKALSKIKEKLGSLNIAVTPREEFEKQFKYYEQNWRELIK